MINAPESHHIFQGEQYVSGDRNALLTAVLGSCVACCLHDPSLKIGGMNHFLLPQPRGGDGHPALYGAQSMELLINALLRRGSSKSHMQAKLFGGASMFGPEATIGQRNVRFARDFLAAEGIRCTTQSVLGQSARRIKFWPYTGKAMQKLIPNTKVDNPPLQQPVVQANSVALF